MRMYSPGAETAGVESLAADAARAERAADWDAAFTAHQRLFWAAMEAGDTEAAASALRGQSRVCQQRGRFDDADEYASLSLEIAERAGHAAAAARAVNTLAVVRFLQHDWEGAGALYAEAGERARDCGDDALVGWSGQNLGVLANLRGDLRRARALYLESVAAAVRSGDATTAMTAYNSLGMVCADLEEWTESGLYFDRGLELAEQHGDVRVRATLLCNRAEPMIFVGETDRALATLREAEEIAVETGDQRTLSEVNRFRGVIARVAGAGAEAEECLTRAMEIAERAGLDLERAEAMEELARLRWGEGRRGPARATAREAQRAYAALGAAHNATRLAALLASWAPSAAAE
jgi:tetratricopeptide (TPR) repeat protein